MALGWHVACYGSFAVAFKERPSRPADMPKPRPDFQPDRLTPVFDRVLLARPLSVEVDWPRWLRGIERKRRALAAKPPFHDSLTRQATLNSFKLEGIEATDADMEEAVTPTRNRRLFRSRQRQRVRNHLAILLLKRQPLKAAHVLRWYTVISSGLSTASLALPGMIRIESVVRRINSPQMRLQPAIQEIAKLHCDLLADAMFPSFNGILSRLLLRVHLGHCGLPAVVFDPALDRQRFSDANLLLPRLLELIDRSLDRLLAH
jgi:hypothetical protein